MKFWWWLSGRGRKKIDAANKHGSRVRLDRSSAPDMDDQEAAEYEDVLNSALNGPPGGVLFERGEDGVLRQKDT
jgi:hypothetical protein